MLNFIFLQLVKHNLPKSVQQTYRREASRHGGAMRWSKKRKEISPEIEQAVRVLRQSILQERGSTEDGTETIQLSNRLGIPMATISLPQWVIFVLAGGLLFYVGYRYWLYKKNSGENVLPVGEPQQLDSATSLDREMPESEVGFDMKAGKGDPGDKSVDPLVSQSKDVETKSVPTFSHESEPINGGISFNHMETAVSSGRGEQRWDRAKLLKYTTFSLNVNPEDIEGIIFQIESKITMNSQGFLELLRRQ